MAIVKQCEALHYINFNTLNFRYFYNHLAQISIDHLFSDCGFVLVCDTKILSQTFISIIQQFHEKSFYFNWLDSRLDREIEKEGIEGELWSIHSGGFYSQAQGGAFRLFNGNTLITEATESYIFEVTTSGETVWEYNYTSATAMIARAERYTYDYFDNISLSGDINGDSIVNILDIIMCINIILGISETIDSADLNQDGIINILDVVTLVNIVLGLGN